MGAESEERWSELPLDLLACIFQLTFQECQVDVKSLRKAHWSLAGVCRSWRSVALPLLLPGGTSETQKQLTPGANISTLAAHRIAGRSLSGRSPSSLHSIFWHPMQVLLTQPPVDRPAKPSEARSSHVNSEMMIHVQPSSTPTDLTRCVLVRHRLPGAINGFTLYGNADAVAGPRCFLLYALQTSRIWPRYLMSVSRTHPQQGAIAVLRADRFDRSKYTLTALDTNEKPWLQKWLRYAGLSSTGNKNVPASNQSRRSIEIDMHDVAVTRGHRRGRRNSRQHAQHSAAYAAAHAGSHKYPHVPPGFSFGDNAQLHGAGVNSMNAAHQPPGVAFATALGMPVLQRDSFPGCSWGMPETPRAAEPHTSKSSSFVLRIAASITGKASSIYHASTTQAAGPSQLCSGSDGNVDGSNAHDNVDHKGTCLARMCPTHFSYGSGLPRRLEVITAHPSRVRDMNSLMQRMLLGIPRGSVATVSDRHTGPKRCAVAVRAPRKTVVAGLSMPKHWKTASATLRRVFSNTKSRTDGAKLAQTTAEAADLQQSNDSTAVQSQLSSSFARVSQGFRRASFGRGERIRGISPEPSTDASMRRLQQGLGTAGQTRGDIDVNNDNGIEGAASNSQTMADGHHADVGSSTACVENGTAVVQQAAGNAGSSGNMDVVVTHRGTPSQHQSLQSHERSPVVMTSRGPSLNGAAGNASSPIRRVTVALHGSPTPTRDRIVYTASKYYDVVSDALSLGAGNSSGNNTTVAASESSPTSHAEAAPVDELVSHPESIPSPSSGVFSMLEAQARDVTINGTSRASDSQILRSIAQGQDLLHDGGLITGVASAHVRPNEEVQAARRSVLAQSISEAGAMTTDRTAWFPSTQTTNEIVASVVEDAAQHTQHDPEDDVEVVQEASTASNIPDGSLYSGKASMEGSSRARGSGGVARIAVRNPKSIHTHSYCSLSSSSSSSHMSVAPPPHMLRFNSKQPHWNANLRAWCLNFGGRVRLPSSRNFQLVMPEGPGHDHDPQRVVLQFGKVGHDTFCLDWDLSLLSPIQALATSLTSFHNTWGKT